MGNGGRGWGMGVGGYFANIHRHVGDDVTRYLRHEEEKSTVNILNITRI
jgi:hypothetical protein